MSSHASARLFLQEVKLIGKNHTKKDACATTLLVRFLSYICSPELNTNLDITISVMCCQTFLRVLYISTIASVSSLQYSRSDSYVLFAKSVSSDVTASYQRSAAAWPLDISISS